MNSNIRNWLMDLLIGALPITIKAFIIFVFGIGKDYLFQTDWIILCLTINILNFNRIIVPIIDNVGCELKNMNELVKQLCVIIFFYNFLITFSIYVYLEIFDKELPQLGDINLFPVCLWTNIFFSFCFSVLKPGCQKTK